MTSTVAQITAALALLLATTVAAEQVGLSVTSDLNHDGLAEQFTLQDTGQGTVDLHIENTGGATIRAQDIAWIGGIGQQATLSLADNGSLQLTSMNESVGPHRWHLILTIAYRNNAYRVAGLTYDQYDTINANDYQLCDLNLLTGQGYTERGANLTRQTVQTSQAPLPVTAWKDSTPIPSACHDKG